MRCSFGAEKEVGLLSAVYWVWGEEMCAGGLGSWVRGPWHGLTWPHYRQCGLLEPVCLERLIEIA